MSISEKNKESWNAFATKYARYSHADKAIAPIVKDSSRAFHAAVWAQIQERMPSLQGKRIAVPSSGDNHAVFAFALMGAKVTSSDIAENQLVNAKAVAERLGIENSIEFVCADTTHLTGLPDDAYDFVYTSNGVHVWIEDLNSMYRNIRRILKPGGSYMLYDIHPFQRPFDDLLNIEKPYDCTGPLERGNDVVFHWRMQDIVNAMLHCGLKLTHMEELFAEKDYDWPFWLSCEDVVNGVTASPEEVDRMHDWRQNPSAALPSWLYIVAEK